MAEDRCAGLHGLVDQLPVRWTAEKRDKWLEALILVLDFSVTVYTPKEREAADG